MILFSMRMSWITTKTGQFSSNQKAFSTYLHVQFLVISKEDIGD